MRSFILGCMLLLNCLYPKLIEAIDFKNKFINFNNIMNLTVEYLDQFGNIANQTYFMSKLAFIKHFAMAGLHYAPNPRKIIKAIGMLLHYSLYLQRNDYYNNNRFSLPPIPMYDPTEKGQFSNIAGKSIADFLSKRIDSSLYTVNYEAVMRLNGFALGGSHPDLIAYSPNSIFAIEAKGRTDSTYPNMSGCKIQATSGPVSVNFSIACVSYNLYNRIKCKYHDPFKRDIPYDNSSLKNLTKAYYTGLLEFLNPDYFHIEEKKKKKERFYSVDINYWILESSKIVGLNLFKFYKHNKHFFNIFPKLILSKKIREYARNGISIETKPFILDTDRDRLLYVDNDRVGLKIEN